VSWHIKSSRADSKGWVLRGCIGTFEPQELAQGLLRYTYVSALNDHRFPPISVKELPFLECTVNFLTPFELCRNLEDWEVGIHGIYVVIPRPGRSLSLSESDNMLKPDVREAITATFLPDIASAQGWSKAKTIENAVRKAGIRGTLTPAFYASLRLYRYQGLKARATWDDYLAWKQGNKAH